MSGKTQSGKPENPDEPVAASEDAVLEKKKAGGKKKLILLAAPVLLIVGLAGLWFSGVLPGLLGMRHTEKPSQEASKPEMPVYVDLPDMIANLAGPSTK